MRSLGIVEKKVINKLVVEGFGFFFFKQFPIVLNKFLLKGMVESLNNTVLFWASGVSKEMGNTIAGNNPVKMVEEFTAVIGLDSFNLVGSDFNEFLDKV